MRATLALNGIKNIVFRTQFQIDGKNLKKSQSFISVSVSMVGNGQTLKWKIFYRLRDPTLSM